MSNSATILGSRILIVDDQLANIRLLEKLVRRAGYMNVMSTLDPTSVCRLHLENHFDLILLDLLMPQMDGFQVMEALKQVGNDPYLPVLVITGQSAHKLRALQSGARDFIDKPFDNLELLTRIHNMLEIGLLHAQAKAYGAMLEDTVRKRTAELRSSEEMFRELAANIPQALWIRDVEQQTILYANSAWDTLTGLRAAPGDPIDKMQRAIHPDDLQWVTHERRHGDDAATSSEYRLVRPDQTVHWVHAKTFAIANPLGCCPWIVEIIEDITQRKEAQQNLFHLSRHDTLTALPNRMQLYETLQVAIAHAEEAQLGVSVLLVDIDFFKAVNDTLGHRIGDEVLQEFASRLIKCVRPGDTVGRLGGDEFAMIVPAPIGSEAATSVAERIQQSMHEPMEFDGQSISVTASTGIASYPKDASDLESLIHHADTAMYGVKASGKRAFRCYTAEMHAQAIEKSAVGAALRLALERDEFVLHYQPKMHIDTGRWTGVEALLRWNRPGHGLVQPGEFIPELEKSGLIVPIGSWVIGTACRQLCEWKQSGLRDIRISVNISPRQIREDRFASGVADILGEYDLKPSALEFEITESALSVHDEAASAALRELKNLGILISVDDFGTGSSNLAYLKRFAVDALKIDIAFIRDVTTNPDDATIAVAIINMGHSLRLNVSAEGVETREQLDFLRMHGCDEFQGFFLSKPLPADELASKLRQSTTQTNENRFIRQNSRWNGYNASDGTGTLERVPA